MNSNLPSHTLVSSDPLSAMKMAEAAFTSAKKVNDNALASTALTIKSICQTEAVNFQLALGSAELSLAYALKSKDKRRIGYAQNIFGKSLTSTGQHIKALKFLHASKATAKQINDPILMDGSSRNLLITYAELGDFDTALLILLELGMTTSMDDPMYESYQQSNLASLYHIIGDHKSALQHSTNALASIKALEYPLDYCRMLGDIARSCTETGQFEKSREHSLEGLEIANDGHFLLLKASALYELGYSYFKEGNVRKSKKNVGDALKIFSTLSSWNGVIDCHNILSKIYLRQNEPNRAFQHIKVFIPMGEKAKAFGLIGSYYKDAAKTMELLHQARKAHQCYQKFCQYDDNLSEFKNNALLLQLSDRFEAGTTSNDETNGIESLSLVGYRQETILTRIKKEMSSSVLPTEKEKFIRQLVASLLELQKKGGIVQPFLSDEQREFSAILIRHFPRITKTELVVCQLLRIGSSTKEIAGILVISGQTVSKHRKSIRSKLEVPSSMTIQAFLLGLSDM